MAKYIISWNIGYGDNYEVIEAESEDEASKQAYEAWREGVENNADYYAEKYTDERAEDLGLD